jgi:DNA-binding XRE family transcriptional regulator
VTPDEVRALRKELGCTVRELATALDIDDKTVFAWEKGDLFPTKRYVDRMQALRDKGPDAFPRRRQRKAPADPMARLDDPRLWQLVRKLLAHPELFDQVTRMAESYDDPAPRS